MFNFGEIDRVINTKLITGNIFPRQRMESSWNSDAKFQTAGLPLVIQLLRLSTPQLLLLTPQKRVIGELELGFRLVVNKEKRSPCLAAEKDSRQNEDTICPALSTGWLCTVSPSHLSQL